MEEKNPREMTDQEILDEYDLSFAGARTYATKELYERAMARKFQLKSVYDARQTEQGTISQGVRSRRVL